VRVLALAAVLAACVPAPAEPYTVEHPVTPFSVGPALAAGLDPWSLDGPGKVLTVRNPTARPARVEVACYSGRMEYGPARWVVNVPARGEVRALVTLENRDQITNACRVERWDPIEEASPHGP
jgi:hypothetical protein